MLYKLIYLFHSDVSLLNVFRYITFRAVLATITALLISFFLGPWVIGWLRALQVKQHVRDDGPPEHKIKEGTPTMGGLLILVATLVPTLLWARLDNDFVWLMVFATIWLGAVGFADDYLKVSKKRNLGLPGRHKLLGQVAAELVELAAGNLLLTEARNHYELGRTYYELGRLQQERGRLNAARDSVEKAMAIFRRLGAREWKVFSAGLRSRQPASLPPQSRVGRVRSASRGSTFRSPSRITSGDQAPTRWACGTS